MAADAGPWLPEPTSSQGFFLFFHEGKIYAIRRKLNAHQIETEH